MTATAAATVTATVLASTGCAIPTDYPPSTAPPECQVPATEPTVPPRSVGAGGDLANHGDLVTTGVDHLVVLLRLATLAVAVGALARHAALELRERRSSRSAVGS